MLSRPTAGRSVDRRLTDDRPIRRPFSDRHLADTRPTLGRHSTGTQPIYRPFGDRQSTEVLTATPVDTPFKTQDPKLEGCFQQ